MQDLDKVLGTIWRSTDLHQTLYDLCKIGGRLCGTPAEQEACNYLVGKLRSTKARISDHTCKYSGWKREHTRLQILDGAPVDVATTSLQQSPNTPEGGLELDVVDVGRGSVEEFKALAKMIPGRAALARHEYFFTQTHVPRRRKYALSKEFGASAFLIANYLPGTGIVNGVAGRGEPDDIPSVGMSYESGERLSQLCREGKGRVRVEVRASRVPGTSQNIIAEIPGQTDEWVVLSAHYDGQHLGQSAMDNGSGTAAAIEVFQRMAPYVPSMRRGLRLVLFTLEHWGLLGSKLYVQDLPEAERRKIALAINLDTVGGGSRLSACTSGVEELTTYINKATAGGPPLNIVRALQINSDHYNFHLAGIPAFRLIAGFEELESNCKFMMSAADTFDKVAPIELANAALTTARLVAFACEAESIAKHRSKKEVEAELDLTDPWVNDRVKAR